MASHQAQEASSHMISDNTTPSDLCGYIACGYRLGWSFTPLNGKVPVNKGWQKRPRETLEEALAWADKGNVGMRTGRASGIVVVDVDPGADLAELDLPGTVTALTGRAGAFHLYFHTDEPIGNSSGKLTPHVDVRGDGGQVVFPGSTHPETGAPYTWAEGHEPWNVEVAELPAHIIERLRAPEKPKAAPTRTTTPAPDVPAKARHYVQTAMKMELHAVCSAGNGTRNQTLNKASFALGRLIGGGYLDRTEVETALRGAAESVGLKPAEIDATVRSGLEAGLAQPRQIELKASPATQACTKGEYVLTPGAHRDDQDRYTEQSSAAFADEVLSRLPADAIYRRDFIPGEILGQSGKRKWVEFAADRMRIVIDTHCKLGKWVTSRKSKQQVMLYQACNKDAAGVVIAQSRQAPHIRELRLIVEYPIYAPGFVRVSPGWHDGLYYDEPDDLRDLTAETDCEVIHNVLHDLVVDFPFKTPADRENFFGLLLTPVVAPAIDGNRPMHLLNAPLERTGKSKLVNEVFGGVLCGRDTPSMQITDREEEREKRILAMLLQGETLMHLDNLPHFLDSTSLSSLLTTQRFLGRVLGHSRNIALPNDLTVVGTGNNVQATGEIAKRIVPIMIEPTSAHPEFRTDFQHPDIRTYVRKHRRTVIECLLGLVENWLAAGRPKHPNRLGGFENWSEIIGGILQVNGLRKWRINEGEWRKQADPRGQEWEAFVAAWYDAHKLEEVMAKELLKLAEQNELFAFVFSKQSPQARGAVFGKLLRRHVDAPIGKWFIRQRKSRHALYRLEVIS